MKKLLRMFGIMAVAAILGFSLIACGGGGGSKPYEVWALSVMANPLLALPEFAGVSQGDVHEQRQDMIDKTLAMSVAQRIALMEKIKLLPREQNPSDPPVEGKRYTEAEIIDMAPNEEEAANFLAFLNAQTAIFEFERDGLSATSIDVIFIRKH